MHAAAARSTFRSQNIQNTPCPEHFWKLRCSKSARGFGAKHISNTFESQTKVLNMSVYECIYIYIFIYLFNIYIYIYINYIYISIIYYIYIYIIYIIYILYIYYIYIYIF